MRVLQRPVLVNTREGRSSVNTEDFRGDGASLGGEDERGQRASVNTGVVLANASTGRRGEHEVVATAGGAPKASGEPIAVAAARGISKKVRFIDGNELSVHQPCVAGVQPSSETVHLYVEEPLYSDISRVVRAGGSLDESYMVRRIMDSGASMNMTSTASALLPESIRADSNDGIHIQGFNGTQESTSTVGCNEDGFRTALLGSHQMPEGLELLCAHDYASLGAIVLHETGGSVLALDAHELTRFKKYIQRLQEVMRLKVHRKIYEVDASPRPTDPAILPAYSPPADHDEGEDAYFNEAIYTVSYHALTEEEIACVQFAYNSIYTLGRVHYTDTDSRIYGHLLSGIAFITLHQAAEHQSLLGLHPTVTKQTLRKFVKSHGSTPDLLAKAIHDQVPHYHAYEKEETRPTSPGQHLLNDTFFSDFNEASPKKKLVQPSAPGSEPLLEEAKRVSKLPTWGGAVAMNLTVCSLTGFVHGYLVQPQVTALQIVTQALDTFATGLRCTTEVFAADEGIVSDSKFTVSTPPVRQLLLQRHIRFQKALPYHHSIGLSKGELTGRYIKRLQRLAYQIGISNPALRHLGYTQHDISKCWGETFYWAVVILSTRPAWNSRTQTRYEAALGRKFNMITIPLLPIFSILLAWHPTDKTYVHCLYVGPAWRGIQEEPTPGAIRAMYKRGTSTPSIFITAGYKCVTSGSGIDTEKNMQRSTARLLMDRNEPRVEAPAPIASATDTVGGEERDYSTEEGKSSGEGTDDDEATGRVQAAGTRASVEPSVVVASEPVNTGNDAAPVEYDTEVFDEPPEMVDSDDEDEDAAQAAPESRSIPRRVLSRRRRRRQRATVQQDAERPAEVQSKGPGRELYEAAQEGVYSRPYKASTRSERYLKRDAKTGVSMFAYEEEYNEAHDPRGEYALFVESLFADWSNASHSVYYSYEQDRFIQVTEDVDFENEGVLAEMELCQEFGYRAVTQGVPRTWSEALRHPLWGDAARTEKDTLLERSMVLVPREVAVQAVTQGGAELVNLFPVFEEKVKEGKTVYKVRLVGDGRQQKHAGATYSETPSRDEFRIFMHLVGHHGWDFFHCDERRAFLNAKFIGETPVYARLGPEFFKVVGALYGLKASPRHYQVEVIARLTRMGFRRLGLCSCIYIKHHRGQMVIVFDYVDDFIWTGSDAIVTVEVIEEFCRLISTTPYQKNPTEMLGMHITRNWATHTIHLSMGDMIDKLNGKLDAAFMEKYSVSKRDQAVPLTVSNVHIEEDIFTSGALLGTEDARLLDTDEVLQYLSLVGGLLWQIGIRWDILYAVLYLTWFTHLPRVHHMKMAARVIIYLYQTRSIELILGGTDKLEIITTTDATLNTAPKGRSVIAYCTRLGRRAGLVSAKCRASVAVLLSTFESELHGVDRGVEQSASVHICLTDVTEAMKQAAGVANMATEMGAIGLMTTVYSDNKAMVDYVNGRGQAKGIKHALLRLWYLREQVMKGINLEWVEGITILANPMTKAVHQTEHFAYRLDVQGYHLLD